MDNIDNVIDMNTEAVADVDTDIDAETEVTTEYVKEKTLYNGMSKNCCAFCNLHKVGLTYKQVRGKECLKKQCWHLQKNEWHPIWKARDIKKERRRERKKALQSLDKTI